MKISAIIPTIGRPDSLNKLLESLCLQTQKPDEIIIADGSDSQDIKILVSNPRWLTNDLNIKHIEVKPPNAVKQRQIAISESSGEFLLLLDDDVVLESQCLEEMFKVIKNEDQIVGVMADFNNQNWSQPTTAWRWYLKYICGLKNNEWQGKVVGPLLHFGYNPAPTSPVNISWLATCNSLIRHSAYNLSGGFSDFFLRRCTMNEDVDLGLKLSKIGRIVFCPSARLGHFHAPSGRVSPMMVAEDDLYNRFMILHHTANYSKIAALFQVLVFFIIESSSIFLGCTKRLNFSVFLPLVIGRLNGIKFVFTSFLKNKNTLSS